MVIVENLGRNEITGETRHNYFYRVIKNNITLNLNQDSIDVQAYGIEVERQDVENGILICIERESIKCISPHRHKVHNLLKLLCDNMVSPIHVVEILGEYIDEYATDFDTYNKNAAMN